MSSTTGEPALDLKRFSLLSELSEEDREIIGEELEGLEVEAGAELYDEGEQGDGLYFVAEGEVRVESTHTGASAVFGPGSAMGAFSLVSSGPRETRASASQRSRLLVLRRSTFRRISEAEPRAACRLLEAILRETARLGREVLVGAQADIDPR